MSSEGNGNPICPNGHRQTVAGSRFCIFCGVAIDRPVQPPQHSVPQSPVQQQPVAPPQFHQQPQPPPIYQQVPAPTPKCQTCGGFGAGLADARVMCPECRWLRPLVPGYRVDSSAFAWAADAKAMAALRAITPLNAAAKGVSEKVGRRWIEVTFNGVRLGEKQMPQVFGQAVRAARILGMTHMPDVYLSGERPWDMLTFGSDTDSFIVIGSAMAGNFQGIDMLYLLAREIGHCKAGHALWKTVIRFFLGEQGPARGVMAGGIFNAILSPSALIGGAIEMPLLAWARQAEITADRAGLLAVGSEEIARRVLMAWSLKSSLMYRQLNMDAWIEQQSVDDGDMLRLSELTTTSTPYLGPRLKLLTQYAKSPELQSYLRIIGDTIKKASPPKPKEDGKPRPTELKLKCSTCSAPMRVPMSVLEGKQQLSVKCPDAKCGKLTVIRKNPKPAATRAKEMNRMENQNYAE